MVHQSQFIEMFGSSDYPKNLLGDLCKILAGKTLPLDVENEGGPIAYIKVADMNLPENDRVVTTSTRSVTEETANISGILPIGATVFPKNGAAALHNKKRITAITTCVDMNTMGVYSTSDALDPEFLYAFLVHQDVALLTLTGAIPQIRPKDIAALTIPLPPLERQRRYIGMVGQADKSKFGSLKSQFIEMFGKSFSSNATIPLSEMVQEDRPITYGVIKPGGFVEEGVILVRVKDIVDGKIYLADLRRITNSVAQNYIRSTLSPGDILLSIRGTIGRTAIVPEELEGANITQDTARISLKEEYNNLFIKCVLDSPVIQDWIQLHVKGLAVKGINLEDVRRIPIPSVEDELQKNYITLYHQADKSKYLS